MSSSGETAALRRDEVAAGNRAAISLVVAVAAVVASVTVPAVALVIAIGVYPAAIVLRVRAFRRVLFRRLLSLVPIAAGAGFVRGWAAHAAGAPFSLAIAAVGDLCSRMVIAALWLTWLGVSLPDFEIDRGLRRIGVSASIVQLLALTRRFAGQLRDTATTAWSAAAVRGGLGSTRATSRTLGLLAGVVLVRALERSEQVSDAMAVRGHNLHESSR